MKTAGTLLSLTLALLWTGGISEADVVTAYHDGGVPVAGLPGYKGYTVFFTTGNPSNPPAGFEVYFDGPLNQIKAFETLDTPTMTLAQHLGEDIEKDSHILFFDEQFNPVVYPGESESQLFSGSIAIWPEYRLEPMPLAYLVIADGDKVVLSGVAGNASANIYPQHLIIPEPVSLAFLALGGLAMIRRRRG